MTEGPGYPPHHLLRDLSLPRRVLHLVTGLGGLAVAVLIAVLWATEPGVLPTRTRFAFAGLIVLGLAWAGFAGWALARRPLFAADRIVAAGLALAAGTAVTIATVTIGLVQGSTEGLLAAVVLGLAAIFAASMALARARAHRRALLARRREMEDEGGAAVSPPADRTPTTVDRQLLPIGPLALAVRHFSTRGRAVFLATVLATGLIAGLALLLS